jgi:hypothetical protein
MTGHSYPRGSMEDALCRLRGDKLSIDSAATSPGDGKERIRRRNYRRLTQY